MKRQHSTLSRKARRLRRAIDRVVGDTDVVAIRAAALRCFAQPIPDFEPFPAGMVTLPGRAAGSTGADRRPYTRIGIST